METVKSHKWIVGLSLLFIAINAYLFFNEIYYLAALPFVLIIVYLTFYKLHLVFLLVAFFTPLSINLEEFTDGKIGLFLPTEPILFGLLIWIIFKQTYKNFIAKEVFRHPLTIILGLYLLWTLITAITSELPLVSFKYLLMKTWFIVPLILLGAQLFYTKTERIIHFLWLFSTSMVIIICFSVIRHYGYGFGEKEGHWVMEPFFKDHTIYGAIVAINIFFLLALYSYKKHTPLLQLTLIIFLGITLTGLYFSYTRGAWLSVAVALVVWVFIHFKVKFKYLFITGIISLTILFSFWDQIEMALAKNRSEHTTEEFDERLRSATNITSDASNLERLNRWDAAWRMYKARPIFGFGPGTYAFEYAPYQDPEKLTIISTNFGDAGNAHSEYLGPLAEMGTLGFLIILAFVSLLFYKGITLYIKYPEKDKTHKLLLLFLILAMVTYFFHGLLNNYLDTDKAAVPVYGVCAIIIALEMRLKKSSSLSENNKA